MTNSEVKTFGRMPSGENVASIRLLNSIGTEVMLLNLGARIHRIKTHDNQGNLHDIVLYCENLENYARQQAFLGASIGRFANRIGNSWFRLNGENIKLNANEGPHHLHGGPHGFDKYLWDFKSGNEAEYSYVRFELISADRDQGYPGELTTHIEYRLFEDNRLLIDIIATTNRPTVVNITNHSYFNLSGDLFSTLQDHYFCIPAKKICATDPALIPDGAFLEVNNTVLDLQQPQQIYRQLQDLPPELQHTRGYDHSYAYENNSALKLMASVLHEPSARKLMMYSTQPCMQFYSGNHLHEAKVIGPGNRPYKQYNGFCLEPQHFPDSPNHVEFPSTRLDPNQLYHQQIVYEFGLHH